MATDTTKITGAADDLSDKLTKGGSAAKTLGAEIAAAIASLDSRVSALEAGGGTVDPPPIEPPASDEGRIENFNATGSFTIGGVNVSTQTAKKAWSLTKTDDYSLRFEHRIGDIWTDGDNTFRSEISWGPHWDTGQTWRSKYKQVIHNTGAFTNAWMTLDQVHDTLGVGNSPPYVMEMSSDRKQMILCRWGNQQTKTLWTNPNQIEYEREYAFDVQYKFDPNNGTLKVWLDGAQIVNYAGPIGFAGSQYYHKCGIYRSKTSSGTVAMTYRNMTLERI